MLAKVMNYNPRKELPSQRAALIDIAVWTCYYVFTQMTIGLRPIHLLLSGLFNVLFFASRYTRSLALCMIPFLLFGIKYDYQRLFPNYLYNEICVEELYNLEKSLFGVNVDGQMLTLNEFFAQHTCAIADFLAGIFYLCWVPVPVAFGFYLFLSGRQKVCPRFTWGFLLLNLAGFCIYYIFPAAPPWYYAQYGAEPILGLLGSPAGLVRFDHLLGITLFQDMYGMTSNVYAAMPSMHCTFCFFSFLYALKSRSHWSVRTLLGIISAGICFTAVYSGHHYLLDVIAGVTLAFAVYCLCEYVIVKRLFRFCV